MSEIKDITHDHKMDTTEPICEECGNMIALSDRHDLCPAKMSSLHKDDRVEALMKYVIDQNEELHKRLAEIEE